jgi:hypothetical protein
VYVQSVGPNSSLTLSLSDSSDEPDLVYVTGANIPLTSSISVQGDLRDDGINGDALVFNTAGGDLDDSDFGMSAGSLRLLDAAANPSSGEVSFENMQFLGSTDTLNQVFHDAAPRPQIAIPAVLTYEGDSVTFVAGQVGGGDFAGDIDVAWDLDGDGQFGDALGSTITLGWQDLQEFGIDDSGNYPVAVRATRETRLGQFGDRRRG